MVTVSSGSPAAPSVFPLMQCGSGAGSTVTLGCLATGYTPSSLTYAWSQGGNALSGGVQYPSVQDDSTYMSVSHIQVNKVDWDNRKVFQCTAKHSAGDVSADLQKIEVHYQLPTLRVYVSSDEESEASFSCFAQDFSPKHFDIKWLKDDKEISGKEYEVTTLSGEREHNDTTLYSATSFLMMPANEWAQEGTTVTCQFKGKGINNTTTSQNASVTFKSECTGIGCKQSDVDVTITGPTLEDIFLTKRGVIVCQAKVNRPGLESISFEDQNGKPLVPTSQTPINGNKISSISLDVSYDEWSQGVALYCVVHHSGWLEPLKKFYERKVGGQIQRPSVFMMPPVVHTKKGTVTLTCFVKEFYPQEVFVSWLVDDEKTDSKFFTTNPINDGGLYSAYGQLSLSLEQWQDNDAVYSCAVYHESVANTTHAVVRSTGYKSMENNNMINLSMDVPSCKA